MTVTDCFTLKFCRA